MFCPLLPRGILLAYITPSSTLAGCNSKIPTQTSLLCALVHVRTLEMVDGTRWVGAHHLLKEEWEERELNSVFPPSKHGIDVTEADSADHQVCVCMCIHLWGTGLPLSKVRWRLRETDFKGSGSRNQAVLPNPLCWRTEVSCPSALQKLACCPRCCEGCCQCQMIRLPIWSASVCGLGREHHLILCLRE